MDLLYPEVSCFYAEMYVVALRKKYLEITLKEHKDEKTEKTQTT